MKTIARKMDLEFCSRSSPIGDERDGPFNDPNKIAWEKRSKLFGTSLKGVLFKGVPDVVNEHVHDWHKKVILHSIGGGVSENIGCRVRVWSTLITYY